jgi:hypothetical protein
LKKCVKIFGSVDFLAYLCSIIKTLTIMGKFEYESGDTKFKGAFNIYQARNGAIMLLMGSKVSALSYSQINELDIDCYALIDFNHDDFVSYYLGTQTNI